MILIDSREKQKAIKKILGYFDMVGVAYDTSKLYVADYMDLSNPLVAVDRKQNIAELATNTLTKDSGRFYDELNRAKAAGIRIVFLIEQNRYLDRGEWINVESISDLMLWQNKFSMANGERLFRSLSTLKNKYDIDFQFCDKRQTGRRILEILEARK